MRAAGGAHPVPGLEVGRGTSPASTPVVATTSTATIAAIIASATPAWCSIRLEDMLLIVRTVSGSAQCAECRHGACCCLHCLPAGTLKQAEQLRSALNAVP